MASIVAQLEQELGLTPGGFAAAFGTEVRQIAAKRAVIMAEWDKRVQEHEAQIQEIDALAADAQKRADELAG